MAWWIWIIGGVLLCLAEIATPGAFYLLFFGLAALVVGLLAWGDLVSITWVQILLFTIFSIIALVTFRRSIKEGLDRRETVAKIHSLEGEFGKVLENISVGGRGRVEGRGAGWNAINKDDAVLEEGQECVVERVEGVSLWVKGV